MEEIINKIKSQLKFVLDPELGINVVDLGLIYDISVSEDGVAHITMTLTTPGCPLHDSIVTGVRYSVLNVEEIKDVDINLVWEPAWSPDKMSPEATRILR
ncbi:metal-sulfur cluster assembly factor [Bacillus massilinigeriensis]|uniref:metal-sulfur cluster assembly factor n=1 Tax=Bacillus massilionigeriensis TaxID=1805475 RepID=UPI000A82DA74|nr:metal-sulfur cluster assembly factor [Bacillus massilionigeriensis]